MPHDLQTEIDEIKARNARVDADKAWETSWCRIIVLAAITYVMMTLLMYVTGVSTPFVAALVPTLGFLISTRSLRFAKNLWIAKFYNKRA